jgi:formylglycine-generating enzyme
MGSDKHYPEEAPAHEVTVEGFWMDRHTVTNEEFRKFVEEGAFASLASWRENKSGH